MDRIRAGLGFRYGMLALGLATMVTPVPEQPLAGDALHRIAVANDLGMHCADLGTRTAVPPTVIRLARGLAPSLPP